MYIYIHIYIDMYTHNSHLNHISCKDTGGPVTDQLSMTEAQMASLRKVLEDTKRSGVWDLLRFFDSFWLPLVVPESDVRSEKKKKGEEFT